MAKTVSGDHEMRSRPIGKTRLNGDIVIVHPGRVTFLEHIFAFSYWASNFLPIRSDAQAPGLFFYPPPMRGKFSFDCPRKYF